MPSAIDLFFGAVWNGECQECYRCRKLIPLVKSVVYESGGFFQVFCSDCDVSIAVLPKSQIPAERLEGITACAKRNRAARSNLPQRLWNPIGDLICENFAWFWVLFALALIAFVLLVRLYHGLPIMG